MLIKTNIPGYARDSDSKAIINTNNESYAVYKQLREERLKNKHLSTEISEVKNELVELKNIVRALLEK